MPVNKGMTTSLIENWATPPEFFEALNIEFGFTLDVCAEPHNAKVARYFTQNEDGLSQDWGREVCWMNPPYGRKIAEWMAKARKSAWGGALVVCLVPARTDTRWWHDYAMTGEVRFIRGRLRFIQPDGQQGQSAPFPSAIVIFRSSDANNPRNA